MSLRNGSTTAVLLLSIAHCSGCSVFPYHYLSLGDVPGLTVEERGVPTVDNIFGYSEMPVLWSLQRNNYRIEFRVLTDTLNTVQVTASAPDSSVQLAFLMRSRRARPAQGTCSMIEPFEGRARQVTYRWFCHDAPPEEWFMSFDVVAPDGTTLGQEDIPFEMKRNGFFTSEPDLWADGPFAGAAPWI